MSDINNAQSCSSCTIEPTKKGCKSTNACASGRCDKMRTYDWLNGMIPVQSSAKRESYAEVRFKNGRKEYFVHDPVIPIRINDPVVVSCKHGRDIGLVSLKGQLVNIQLRKKNIVREELFSIERKASSRDVQIWNEAIENEEVYQAEACKIVDKMNIPMKIFDVECQAFGDRAIIYYTADKRVDFRELIKVLRDTFSIKVEMKQVSSRQEASRIGGVGSCGRELCCSTWLHDFRKIGTDAIRYQQLSINSNKLIGKCGRLKCCLNFELDTYHDTLQYFPERNHYFQTSSGQATLQRIDVLQKMVWYAYDSKPLKWYKIPLDILNQNILESDTQNTPNILETYAVEE